MNSVGITYPDINNGIGFRAALWISGCTHKCPGCHNEWLQDYKIGKPINEFKKELFDALNKPYISGLTLSGGDPLDQSDNDLKQLLELIKEIKTIFPSKTIWIYSGDTYENLIKNTTKKEILSFCDILIDGKFILTKKDLSLPFRGSKNQRIIDLKTGYEYNSIRLLYRND